MIVIRTICATKIPALFFYKDNALYTDSGACSSLEMVTCSPFYKDTSRIVVVSSRTHAISSIRYNLFYKAACNSFSTYACSQLYKDTSKIHVVVSIRTRTISSIRYTLFYKAMQSV